MFEKDGKYYADWRDRAGTRKRKSFTSRRAALQYEADQKEIAHSIRLQCPHPRVLLPAARSRLADILDRLDLL
jgi:hypothetical protein